MSDQYLQAPAVACLLQRSFHAVVAGINSEGFIIMTTIVLAVAMIITCSNLHICSPVRYATASKAQSRRLVQRAQAGRKAK